MTDEIRRSFRQSLHNALADAMKLEWSIQKALVEQKGTENLTEIGVCADALLERARVIAGLVSRWQLLEDENKENADRT